MSVDGPAADQPDRDHALSGQRTSSPASTGGAGTFFEQHVAAYWLAHLLVRGIPPILIDTVVAEAHFQTERLGWQTDDFLIVSERAKTLRLKMRFRHNGVDQDRRNATHK